MSPASTRRRGFLARSLRFFLFVSVALITAGCGLDVVFVGDPALASTLPDTREFEHAIEDAARSASFRSRVYWPEASLNAIALEPIVQEFDAGTIVLSPYLSLLIQEVAPALPDRRFVGYYGLEPLPNLTWVEFDPMPAMTEAGAVLARWVLDAPGRTAVLLIDESDRDRREEGRALLSGYEQEAGIELRREAFGVPPSRDDVRSRVQAIAGGEQRAVVVLLGTATGWALEQLRDEQTVLGLRNVAIPADSDRILFSVRDDLADGLEVALREGGERVVVRSVLDLSPASFSRLDPN